MRKSTRLGLVAPWMLVAAWGCSSTPSEATFDPNKTLDQSPVDNDNKFDPTTNPDASAPTQTPKSLCGNSVLDPGETCDDANTASNDGCSSTCQIEAGWKCPIVGAGCVAKACGDGVRAGDEDCDDANTVDGDGCNSACVLEQGFKCVGTQCSPTTCGDGKKEGTEQCDDGNLRPYDGCSPTCTVEPNCAAGECAAVCGDGIKFPGEDCDDGNMRDGDGCSAKCTKELGYVCSETTRALPDSIDVPIILRDFTPSTSPDFETFLNGVDPGMVKATLAADGEPEFAGPDGHGATNAASFFQWYHDTPNVNQVFFQSLTLTKQPDDSYRYYNGQFYPLDGLGFGNFPGYSHNYHFTSELRQVFTFGGGEKLDFSGDDDVWVFINNRLAVDIGGVHSESADSITLTDDKATTLGLVKGKMYQFVVFQAERHTVDSNYKLTVRGFTKAKTTCAAICGDGVKTKNEACDDGQNTGGYGKCAPGCVLGPRCGDGTLQASEGEQCDDGNLVDGDGCSSKCKTESGSPN